MNAEQLAKMQAGRQAATEARKAEAQRLAGDEDAAWAERHERAAADHRRENEHGLLDSTGKRVTASATADPKARPNPGAGDTSPGIFLADHHERNTAGVDRRHWLQTTVPGGEDL